MPKKSPKRKYSALSKSFVKWKKKRNGDEHKRRLKKWGKKGAYALPMAMMFILINVMFSIIIVAFGNDPMVSDSVGTAGVSTTDVDASTDEDISITKASGWLTGFKATFGSLPWWVNSLIVMFEVGWFALIVYALIRGI